MALIRLLLITIALVLLNDAVFLIAFAAQGKLNGDQLASILTSTLLILPIPPIVLFVVGAIISMFSLKKKQVSIKNLLAPLVMSSVNTIFVDKDSALTSGKLLVKKSIPLKAVGDDYVAQAISNVLCATNNDSAIALALKKEYDLELSSGVIDILPPDSNGCFGASFKGGKTFIVGDPNYLPIANQAGIIKRCEEYFKNGHYVVVLGESKDLISDGKFEGALEAVTLIVIKNCVRDDSYETFKWLKDNDIDVKVITNNDPISSSLLATEAGVNNSDKYISLKGVNFEKVRQIAEDYCVFGDLIPEQKLFLIKALQEKGRTIAAIAGGKNNEPILKQANCSLSFEDDAQIKLNSSSFSAVREIIEEGKKLTNNLRRTIALFLTSAFFIFATSLILLFASIGGNDLSLIFPYSFNNLLLIEIVLCVCGPLLLLFYKNNDEEFKGLSVSDILRKAIPSSLVLIASVVIMFVIYLLQKDSTVSWGVYSIDTFITMSVISVSILSVVVSFDLYSPLTKYRKIVLISLLAFVVILLFVSGLISYLTKGVDSILGLSFIEMSGPAYLITTLVTIILVSLYLYVYRLTKIGKGEKIDNEN